MIRAAIVRPVERHLAAVEPRGRGRKPLPTAVSHGAEPSVQSNTGKGRGRPRKNLQPSLFSALNEADDAA
jgi:hypothetical protein